ncbi:MAG: hypothetical protein WDW38_009632 [Sanguina aurantia]
MANCGAGCKHHRPDGCQAAAEEGLAHESQQCPSCITLPCLIVLQKICNSLNLVQVGGLHQQHNMHALSDVSHCGKMAALQDLLREWSVGTDKVLIFSHSTKTLDLIEAFITHARHDFLRLDGATAVKAQDRAFRIGQKRDVTVFRFVAAGTVEEVIYNRQIYKTQQSNIALQGGKETRQGSDVPSQLCAMVDAFVEGQRTQTTPSYLSIDKDAFAADVAQTNWDQGKLQVSHALALIDSLRHGLAGSDINGEVSHYRYKTWWKRRLSAMDDQPEIDPAMLAQWQAEQHALNLQLLEAISARSG